MTVVAFVHAKGVSERVPGKNLRRLGDRPLVAHAISHALAASRIDRVVVDSDCPQILGVGERMGAETLVRPASLATNAATGDDLARWQAENAGDAAIVMQVIPTSPFLSPLSLDRAVDRLREEAVDSVVGVFAESLYRWERGRPVYLRADGSIPNSSEMEPVVYETTGLYANRRRFVVHSGKRMNPESCVPLLLSRLEAIDVNTEEDFRFAEMVWRGLQDNPHLAAMEPELAPPFADRRRSGR